MASRDLGSVVGPQGPQGATGPQGPQGPQGPAGDDTYTETTEAGYEGTRAEFYTALSGIDGMEVTGNKVTSITESSTNMQYPSAKAVYQLFTSIVDGNEVAY